MGDSCENILRKALAIGEIPEDFDPKKTPQTGEEYLHYVMYEAKQCKEWVKADIDTSKLKDQVYVVKELEGCKSAPQYLRPSMKWQRDQVSDFSVFRLHLVKIKEMNNKKTIQYSGTEVQWAERFKKEPKLSEVLYMNQHCIVKLLEMLTEHLGQIKEGESISYAVGVWIYSLLACLETPLWPEACAMLRDMARKCSVIRSKLDITVPKETSISFNLFICLIARYFNQTDLADETE